MLDGSLSIILCQGNTETLLPGCNLVEVVKAFFFSIRGLQAGRITEPYNSTII